MERDDSTDSTTARTRLGSAAEIAEIRRLYAEGHVQSALALAERVSARERVPLDSVPVVTVTREALLALPLDHRAGFMLTRIDGTSKVKAILDIAAMPSDEALALLGTLETLGALRFLSDEDEKTIRRASQHELPPFTPPRRASQHDFPAAVAPPRRASGHEFAAVAPSHASSRPRVSPPPQAPLTADDETVRRESVWPQHVPRDPARHTPPPPPLPSQALANDDKTQPLAAPWLTPPPLPKEEQTAPHAMAWPATPRADEKTEPGFSLFTESDTQRDKKKN